MVSCEQCWRDSGGDPDLYREFVKVNTCTPEQQAGYDSKVCSYCNRKTIHQYVNVCMNKDCVSRSK